MKIRCRINKNLDHRKLCIFLVDSKGNYKGYVDSIYYDAAGNSNVSNLWDYPEIMLHGQVVPDAQEFFKALFVELRKHIKTFTISANRKCAEKFLTSYQNTLGIRMIEKNKKETIWSL